MSSRDREHEGRGWPGHPFYFRDEAPKQLALGQERVFQLVEEERARQDRLWGEQNHDDYKWLTVLTEEIGEAAEAVLQNMPSVMEKEIIHVAAVAVAWLEAIERRRISEATEGRRGR